MTVANVKKNYGRKIEIFALAYAYLRLVTMSVSYDRKYPAIKITAVNYDSTKMSRVVQCTLAIKQCASLLSSLFC